MKQSAIAAVIERDLLREETQPATNIVACWSCGFTFCYRSRRADLNGNFCSESRGLRCCSTDCERTYRERRDNLTVMAEVGIEPSAKRICARAGCNARIPQWRNGRQVSSKTRFCSPRCQRSARNSQNPISNADTMKKSA